MFIIGISGGTGCGKTTMVNQLIRKFSKGKICVISQDSYYKTTDHLSYNEREKINFDHPDAIDFDLLIEDITALKSGKEIYQPVYSFAKHNRLKDTKHTLPTKVVIVEGILLFNNEKLRELFDVNIFIDTDTDERLIRRIKRDILERNRDIEEVISRYQETLKPMHKQFIEPIKKYADIIIPNNDNNTVAIDVLYTVIKERL